MRLTVLNEDGKLNRPNVVLPTFAAEVPAQGPIIPITASDRAGRPAGEKTAQKVSEKLVKEALKKGSKDNVSVLTVRFRWPGAAV